MSVAAVSQFSPADSGARADTTRLIFHGAWMSVALGVTLQLVALTIILCFGRSAAPGAFVADLTQKVTWSVFVCVGLTLGAAAARAMPVPTGLIGLLAAPAAFVIAKTAHKWVQEMLKLAPGAEGVPAAATLAAIKGLEYAVFGWMLARLVRSERRGLARFALIGAAVGAVFGALLLWMTLAGSAVRPAAVQLTAKAVNELLFPVGCAMVFGVTMRLAGPGAVK